MFLRVKHKLDQIQVMNYIFLKIKHKIQQNYYKLTHKQRPTQPLPNLQDHYSFIPSVHSHRFAI